MIEMIEKISEFLKENISPKAHNLMSVIVVLSSISALVCAIYNSLFLLYLGVGFNKTGIGFYDLIIFDQCLIIFSLLIFLHFIFSIFVLNAFLKIATLFFLLAITTSREVLQNNGYLMDSYWLALIFISVVIAVIGGGIVGSATFYKLQKKNPNLKIALFEKEDILADHQRLPTMVISTDLSAMPLLNALRL